VIFRGPVDEGRRDVLRPWLVIALSCAATFALAGRARAEGPFEGTWREGPLSIQVAVQSWGGDCGPRPQSTSAPGGGNFEITQSGDDLTFHLRRQRTTRGCWSENRAVRRVSSSHAAGTWRIICRTPPDDSRSETGTYTIQAIGSDQLSFRDVSAYDWQLNESRCLATITTTQSFTRVSAPPQAEEPAQEAPRPACTPGAPARLVLRPSSTDLTPGGQQCFTTRVVDAHGCAIRSPRVALSLADGSPGTLSGHCYRAPNDGGEARIVARAGSLRDEARVLVHAMDLSDLFARRTESGSLGNGAPPQDAEAQTAARVSARPVATQHDLRWPALAVGLALLLVIGAALALLRRRRPAKKGIAGLPGVDLTDVEVESTHGASDPGASRDDRICPTCRRGFPPSGTTTCPHDGTELVPYREFAARAGAEKVCPTCGERYPANVKFCGKDGATLEPGGH
jgi:hypothetical protein